MLARLVLIVIGSLVLSALLTPPVMSLILTFWPDFSHPFSRVFDRVFMLVIFGFLLAFRRTFYLSELLRQLKGTRTAEALLHASGGAVLTAGSGFILLLILVYDGTLHWSPEIRSGTFEISALKTLRIIGAALVISLIEESFFRGILFLGFLRTMTLLHAAALSSVIYAVVHFVTPVKSFVYTEFSWLAGLRYLTVIFERLLLPGIFQGIVGLFLVGMVLCLAYKQSRSLYLSIGLHAGWVILIKFTGMLTDISSAELVAAGPGTRYFIISQPITWFYLSLVGLCVCSFVAKFRGHFADKEHK